MPPVRVIAFISLADKKIMPANPELLFLPIDCMMLSMGQHLILSTALGRPVV